MVSSALASVSTRAGAMDPRHACLILFVTNPGTGYLTGGAPPVWFLFQAALILTAAAWAVLALCVCEALVIHLLCQVFRGLWMRCRTKQKALLPHWRTPPIQLVFLVCLLLRWFAGPRPKAMPRRRKGKSCLATFRCSLVFRFWDFVMPWGAGAGAGVVDAV